jgi:hypothetical protein
MSQWLQRTTSRAVAGLGVAWDWSSTTLTGAIIDAMFCNADGYQSKVTARQHPINGSKRCTYHDTGVPSESRATAEETGKNVVGTAEGTKAVNSEPGTAKGRE